MSSPTISFEFTTERSANAQHSRDRFIAQPGRVIHVIVLVPISWPHFEDDGDHCSPTQEKFVVGMQRRDATLFQQHHF